LLKKLLAFSDSLQKLFHPDPWNCQPPHLVTTRMVPFALRPYSAVVGISTPISAVLVAAGQDRIGQARGRGVAARRSADARDELQPAQHIPAFECHVILTAWHQSGRSSRSMRFAPLPPRPARQTERHGLKLQVHAYNVFNQTEFNAVGSALQVRRGGQPE
jgi:hypothetical protein